MSAPFTEDSIVIVDEPPEVATLAVRKDNGWFIWAAIKAASDALVGVPDCDG